jgi:hypothetical protein
VRLAFDHPATGQRIDVAADPGAEFALLAREFGWPRTDIPAGSASL